MEIPCEVPTNTPVDFGSDEELEEHDSKEDLVESIPLKRYGLANEVSEAVLFLASERSSYITGSTIFVDGGYSIT